jgi:hypothetical protein
MNLGGVNMNLLNDEKIFFDVAANLFRGMEAVGGKLKVTNYRLVFESHALNFQTGTTEIPLGNIVEAKKRNTAGIVPNGMAILTRDGMEYRFVVWNRGVLIDFINRCIAR